MNKTKIVATIGPSSQDKEVLRQFFINGVDIIRLNMAFCSYEFCKDIITKVDELNFELKKNISILLDIEGPHIRTYNFKDGSAYFKLGNNVKITRIPIIGNCTAFSVNYKNFIDEVKCHDIIKLNCGTVQFEVNDKTDEYLNCTVVKEGIVYDKSVVNVPDSNLKIPFLSEIDKKNIIFAHEMNVDFISLSCVTCAEDILKVNDMLIELGNDHLGIITKIENEKGVTFADEIIKVSDGVIVARGDLGAEVPLERVPGIQKMIVNKCHNLGKVSLVAAQILSSMENSSSPTRAEVSDVANAVIDGVDAIILSGETTIGKYPVDTLKTVERIIHASEHDIDYLDLFDKATRTEKIDTTGAISMSVVENANRLRCKAIVTPTITGKTSKKISRFRPSCPIVALSPDINTIKNLNIYFGIYPIYINELKTFDKMMSESKNAALSLFDIEKEDRIIITGGYPFKTTKYTNFMKVEDFNE